MGPEDRGAIWPSVTVILPVLDEVEFVDRTLGDLLTQDYEGPFEVVVADGGSTDGTLERLEWWVAKDRRITVIANPEKRQAYGLNRAASEAKGKLLVRADGHTLFAADYVRRSVEVLIDTGGAVGGRMNPVGRSEFGRAVAAAMQNPLMVGPGRFHHASEREPVDTVYLGVFEKEDFEALGGFRPFPSGSSEDADFFYRWRESGRAIFVDPAIVSTYTPRDTPRSLWRQYFRYGLGKAEMVWVNGRPPSLRPLAPLVLVVVLLATTLLGLLAGNWWPLLGATAAWVALLAWVGLSGSGAGPLVVFVGGVMHIAYGLGMMWGLVRGPGPVRHLRKDP